MAKKTKDIPGFTDEELSKMSSNEKLDKLVYLQKEIQSTKDKAKDEAASRRDYLAELNARVKCIVDSIPGGVPPKGSMQEAQAAKKK